MLVFEDHWGGAPRDARLVGFWELDFGKEALRLMIEILHYLKDPKLWELYVILLIILWVMHDLHHQPYHVQVGRAPQHTIITMFQRLKSEEHPNQQCEQKICAAT